MVGKGMFIVCLVVSCVLALCLGLRGGTLIPTAVMQTHVAGLLPATSGSYCMWLLELLKFSSPP